MTEHPKYARPVKNATGAYQYATPGETLAALRAWGLYLEGREPAAARGFLADAVDIEVQLAGS